MAATTSFAPVAHRGGTARPALLARLLAALRSRPMPLARDDRGFAGPVFGELVPGLARETARRLP